MVSLREKAVVREGKVRAKLLIDKGFKSCLFHSFSREKESSVGYLILWEARSSVSDLGVSFCLFGFFL